MKNITLILLIISIVSCKRVPKKDVQNDIVIDTIAELVVISMNGVTIVDTTINIESEVIDKAVEKTVINLFNGIRNSDSILIASSFTFDATITSLKNDTILNTISYSEFLKSVLEPKEEIWEEKISKIDVSIYNNIATLNCEYEFYLSENFHHRGQQSVQLIKINDQWIIQSILYNLE